MKTLTEIGSGRERFKPTSFISLKATQSFINVLGLVLMDIGKIETVMS